MPLLAPSVLSANFANLKHDIETVESAGADLLHVDAMDGRFVPNITVGPCVVKAVRETTDLPIDVHLMIVEPERYIHDFAAAGADSISFHFEAAVHHHRIISLIKELGKRAGIAVNPSTPISFLKEVLPFVDFVLLMSVDPGFGGQRFIETSVEKIRTLKEKIENRGLNVQIEVDGGIKLDNVQEVLKAGANVIVAGSAVFNGNVEKNVKAFKNKFKLYLEER